MFFKSLDDNDDTSHLCKIQTQKQKSTLKTNYLTNPD